MKHLVLAMCALFVTGFANAQSVNVGAGGTAPTPESVALVEPTLPDAPGVSNLSSGQTVARKAGKAGPAIEVFQFIAGTGARVRATASGTGAMILRAYTPEGTEMLRVEGAKQAQLDVFMPTDGIYYMSVARDDGAKSYKLTLDVAEADLIEAALRHAIGYEALMDDGQVASTSCWMESGTKLRVRNPSGAFDIEVTYSGGGKGREVWYSAGGWPPRNFTSHVEGSEIVRTYEDGTSLRFVPFGGRRGAYRGYYCAGATP